MVMMGVMGQDFLLVCTGAYVVHGEQWVVPSTE